MNVLSEQETLDAAIAGRSIARVGEGEYRIAIGQKCISQVADSRLAREMQQVLALPAISPCLPCIPRTYEGMPNPKFWKRFTEPPFSAFTSKRIYGSAFITRPDMVPAIDDPKYWRELRRLWAGKDVTLVAGSMRSLTESSLPDAASVRAIWAPRRDAYAAIGELEEEIGKPSGPVLLCLGATATVLAMRLAAKGVHAVDLGHVGMFMGHEGIFRVRTTDFISPGYLEQQKQMHARPEGYGGSSHRQAQAVIDFAKEVGAEILIDYGCGQGRLKTRMRELGSKHVINEYDPAIEGKDGLPKPADLVVCTDVLEHIEPDKLGATLAHLWSLSKKAAYFLVALRPANKTLPDARNAHLLIESPEWWKERVLRSGWKKIDRCQVTPGHDMKIWLTK